MKVIDNFLSIPDFDKLTQFILGPSFTWYLRPNITLDKSGLDQYQFVHTFFDINSPSYNNWSDLLNPFLDRLQVQYILRVKANCRPRTDNAVLSNYHIDLPLNQQTAIFYLNTNNGYTKFKDNEYDDVKSIANRLVTFYGALKHSGASCTDQNTRIVLNINYIPRKILA